MLEQLLEYAESRQLEVEPGFAPRQVRWAVLCKIDGELLKVQELGDVGKRTNKGQRFARCPILSQPEIKRGGTGCRHFLIDTTAVVSLLGVEKDPKLQPKHDYFVDLLATAAKEIPSLAGPSACLSNPTQVDRIREELEAAGAKTTDNVTFAVLDATPLYPVDSTDWHPWWRAFRATLAKPEKRGRRKGSDTSPTTMRCLASGDLVLPAATQPKIRGLASVGGMSTGDSLASFKQESFQSYGLEQGANAAVSEENATAYSAALNDLIRNGKKLTHSIVAYWYKDQLPPELDQVEQVIDPGGSEAPAAEEEAQRLIAAAKEGGRWNLDNNRYCALTLSGASGRVMVRDWMEGRFEDLEKAVDAWFRDLAIVRRDGNGLAPRPKLLAVGGSLVRDLKDLPPAFETTLWRAAIRGTPIPFQMVASALQRFRVDLLNNQSFNHARMGLLKAFHIRDQHGDTPMKSVLDPEHPSPAYHCGRLMAVLAALQWRALGDVGAGLIQRYYAAASATPGLVIGRLVRNSQFHLAKVAKLSAGSSRWFEAQLAEVHAGIKGQFPRTLTLNEQSLFALGYYHQIATDRAPKEASSTQTDSATENSSDV